MARTIYFAQVDRYVIGAPRVGPRDVSPCFGGPYSDGPIKIGITGRLRYRLRALASSAGQHVHLVGAFDGAGVDERRMHTMFAHLRIGERFASSSEWFRPAWELTSFITSLPTYDVSDWQTVRWRGHYDTEGSYVSHPRSVYGQRLERRLRKHAF